MSKRKYEVTEDEPEVVSDDVDVLLEEPAVEGANAVLDELTAIAQEQGEYDSPSTEAVTAGKSLTGSPDIYNFPVGVVNQLLHFGIAADAGNGTLMRGFRWFQYYN